MLAKKNNITHLVTMCLEVKYLCLEVKHLSTKVGRHIHVWQLYTFGNIMTITVGNIMYTPII